MKKLFLLFTAIPLLFITACSSDDSENTPSNQPFSKVITYTPSFANYTAKRIQYHNADNDIIADSMFDNTGALTQTVVRTLSGNVKTTQRYNPQNTIIGTSTEEYDANGRLIETSGDYNTVFTYNSNNTITATSTVNGLPYFVFSKNADGLINHRLEINDNSTVGLNFQNQLPTEYLNDDEVSGTFTYYPNTMPTNLLQNVNKMNNTILRAYRLEHLPSSCNAYLMSWLWLYRYEREFNSENYQIHSKSISIDGTSETVTAESFYFYY